MNFKNDAIVIRLLIAFCLALILCTGCGKEPAPQPDVLFVREGLAVSSPDLESLDVTGPDGKSALLQNPLPDGFRTASGNIVLPFDWKPGAKYRMKGKTSQGEFSLELGAPQLPAPLLVAEIPLEKMKEFQGRGANPDTYLKFSPDEKYLAIGSFFGRLRVVEVETGKVILEKRVAEGMVKRICWRKKQGGWTLFVGEQSPDSFIYAMDPMTGEVQWKYRLADDLGSSSPDGGDYSFRIYNFPGPYFMQTLPDGDLLAIGLHGRYKGEDFIYDSMVYRLDKDSGKPKWTWPKNGNLPYSITWAGASEDGKTLALMTDTWAAAKTRPCPFKNGALYCMDGETGAVQWGYAPPPLEPHYSQISAWQGVSVSRDGQYVALGLNDGRGMLFKARQDANHPVTPLWIKNIGTPVMNGNIPVASSIAYGEIAGGAVLFGMPGTTIPPNTSSGSSKNKPAPHPRSHTVCAFSLPGEPLWEWQCNASVQGIFPSDDGRWIAVGITDDRSTANPDEFGMAMFDSNRAMRNDNPMVYRYFTEGCVFFMGDVSRSGRFAAITEYPYSPDEGKTLIGEYRVHIVH